MKRLFTRRAQHHLLTPRPARRAFTPPYRLNIFTFSTSTSPMSAPKVEGAKATTEEPAGDITLDPKEPGRQYDGTPLPLPAPPSEEEAQKLDLSSGEATIKMDHLGPLVVNRDGTLSKIGNWEQMTELEKKNTLRILAKRNQLRTSLLQGADAGAKSEENQ